MRLRPRWLALALTLGFCLSAPAGAGEVKIVEAVAYADAGGTWMFDVTLEHGDTGWDHYADQWQVLSPDGTVLGTRTLHHPHVNEQPFRRSLGGVAVPETLDHVMIRARDSVHGYGPELIRVELPR